MVVSVLSLYGGVSVSIFLLLLLLFPSSTQDLILSQVRKKKEVFNIKTQIDVYSCCTIYLSYCIFYSIVLSTRLFIFTSPFTLPLPFTFIFTSTSTLPFTFTFTSILYVHFYFCPFILFNLRVLLLYVISISNDHDVFLSSLFDFNKAIRSQKSDEGSGA